MNTKIIDTHVHLQNPRYDDDLSQVLERAAEAEVTSCIVPGSDLESSRAAVRLAEAYAGGPCALYATVGVHPTNAHTLSPAVTDALDELASHPRVVGIGEIGLDYYWPRRTDRDWVCAEPSQQREALVVQLELAAGHDLPVVIHDREAHEDTLRTLREWKAARPNARGTLHAYAGGPEHLPEVIELGFHIGMDGPVTFKKARELHAVARTVPLERLLLETDGPYLTPRPYRGRRNEPAYLVEVAEQIARLRGVPRDRVAEVTSSNARRLFDIPNGRLISSST